MVHSISWDRPNKMNFAVCNHCNEVTMIGDETDTSKVHCSMCGGAGNYTIYNGTREDREQPL